MSGMVERMYSWQELVVEMWLECVGEDWSVRVSWVVVVVGKEVEGVEDAV